MTKSNYRLKIVQREDLEGYFNTLYLQEPQTYNDYLVQVRRWGLWWTVKTIHGYADNEAAERYALALIKKLENNPPT